MKIRLTSPLVLFFCMVATSAWSVTSGRDTGYGGVVLRASVPMGTVVGTGDRISFEYQTRQDAAVLVFNIDSQGVVHLLSPVGNPEISRANATYPVPSEGDELVVDSQTGVEFVFAISVDDPSAIDTAELDRLRGADERGADPVRIDGDPFVAANMIAGELVRGVSHRGVYFGYTFFYVNDRVEYPCYLCGACDGTADDPNCTDYRVVQNFDRRDPLAYPLKRAYEMAADVAVEDGANIDVPEGSDVDVNFYPYGVEARVVDPFYTSLWSNWYLYDPWYWYGPYYPYYDCYPNFYVGFGWGWGWWGGYYCSGWYAGCGWGYDPGYGGYPSGGYQTPEKFKARYKSDALVSTRTAATQRDGSLRIASKDVQGSVSRPAQTSTRSKTGAVTRTSYATGRSKGAIDAPGSPRVKTSVGGKSSRFTKSTPGGSRSTPRVKGTTAPSRRGIADAPRGGGGYKSRSTAPARGSSRSSVGAPRSSSSMKGSAPSSRGYSAPSRGGAMKSSAPRSAPSSAPRGGGGAKGRGR